MDEITVIWANIAIEQRNKIFEYWNKRNKNTSYSKRLNRLAYKKIDLLKQNSFASIEIENEMYRIIHFGNYSLVYKPEIPIINIVAFGNYRQNPKKLRKILGL